MTLVDANLLLYAYNRSAPEHEAARVWLEGVLSGRELCGLSWQSMLAFIRIGTNPRAFEHPLSLEEAVSAVSAWLTRPMVRVLQPGERHWEILRELLTDGQARGHLAMDAHLAAVAIEHGATLLTTDRDFARFPRLKVLNPLAAKLSE
jgi:uncharacterized protein